MASKRESILDYLVSSVNTALTAGGIAASVRRTRSTPIGKNEQLAVSLYANQESVQQRVGGKADRVLTVQFNVFTRGDEPDALADATVAILVSTLMSDIRLGGLANSVNETGTSWDFDSEISEDYGVASVTFEISYITSASDLSA